MFHYKNGCIRRDEWIKLNSARNTLGHAITPVINCGFTDKETGIDYTPVDLEDDPKEIRRAINIFQDFFKDKTKNKIKMKTVEEILREFFGLKGDIDSKEAEDCYSNLVHLIEGLGTITSLDSSLVINELDCIMSEKPY